MSELDDPTPPAEIPTGHMANATDWRAVSTKPDFCRVGKDVIAFDSYALLTTVHTSSPNVLAQSQKVYREGDFFKVIQSNAGAHIVSGTSLESGFCKILTGQSTVCVNGKPVACHNSYVMLNCNAAGEGGTTGKVATEPPKPAPKPDSKKDGLLDIDPMAALMDPKGELEKLKKKILGKAKGEINTWLKESPVGPLLTEIKKADEKLNSMVRPVINQAKEWFGQTPVGKFVSGFRSENKRVEEEYVKDRVGGFKTLWEAIPFTSDAATSAAARGRIQESLVNSLNVIGALMGPSQEQILAASVSGSREDWEDIEAQQKIQQQTAEAIVEGVRGATEGAYNRGGIGGVAGFFGTHIAIFVAECAVGGEVASVAGKVASFSGKAISKGAMEAADVIKGIANVAKTPAQAVELTEAAVNAAKLAGAGEGKMGPLLTALKAVKEQKVLAEELAKKAAEMKKGVHVNPKPKPKLPTATDATATSPYRSNRDYGKTTMTDANGNRIPTEPSLPGAGANGGVVTDEAAALGRIGKNGNGPILNGKAPNTVLNQQAVNDLANGSLPGITKNPKTGLPDVNPRTGVPREMPGSINPSATAEDFANRLFGDTSPPVNASPIKSCPGCWTAQTVDGAYVTYRPANTASGKTLQTTASVNINFEASGNALNGGKELKLKFPQK